MVSFNTDSERKYVDLLANTLRHAPNILATVEAITYDEWLWGYCIILTRVSEVNSEDTGNYYSCSTLLSFFV